HHLARTATTRTGLLEVQHAAHRHAHLAGSMAGIAGGGIGTLGRAGAVAGLALGQPRHLDLDAGAEHGLLQRQFQLIAQVGAPEHLRAATATAAAEDVTEHITEDVAEVRARAETVAAGATAPLRIQAFMAVLVIDGPLGGVGEYFVGLLDLLELLLGLGIAGIAVGMQLHGEAPVGLLDVGLRRITRHVQNLVVVALRHAACLALPAAGHQALRSLSFTSSNSASTTLPSSAPPEAEDEPPAGPASAVASPPWPAACAAAMMPEEACARASAL